MAPVGLLSALMLLTLHRLHCLKVKAQGLIGWLGGLQSRLPYWRLEDCNANVALGVRVCKCEAGIWEV